MGHFISWKVWTLSQVWNQFKVLGENKSESDDIMPVLLIIENLDYLKIT